MGVATSIAVRHAFANFLSVHHIDRIDLRRVADAHKIRRDEERRLRRDRQHSRIAKSESAQAVKTLRAVIRDYGHYWRSLFAGGQRSTLAPLSTSCQSG